METIFSVLELTGTFGEEIFYFYIIFFLEPLLSGTLPQDNVNNNLLSTQLLL